MKCEPYPNSVLLRPETALEASAIARWFNSIATQRAELDTSNDHRYSLIIDFREPEDPPAPDRVPGWLAPGRWVRDRRSRRVGRVLPPPGRRVASVQFPGEYPGPMAHCELEPWAPRVGERVRHVSRLLRDDDRAGVVESIRPDGRFDLVRDGGLRSTGVPIERLEPCFGDPPAPPEPATRTVRVPAPGQRVRVTMRPSGAPAWTREDVAVGFEFLAAPAVLLRHGDGYTPRARPEDVEPIGDDPRWIEIELPEETKE